MELTATTTPLSRSSLRDQARRRVRDLVLRNDLPAGERINESHLAERLGISRTPLREALNHLEQEGFLESEVGRGYFVRALDMDEARDLYVLLADLETLALRLSGPAPADRTAELRRLNDLLPDDPGESDRAIRTNRRWHETLVAACPNRRLLEILGSLHRHVARYEHAWFVAGEERLRASKAFHEAIIEAQEKDDETEIRAAVERHWLSDLEFIEPRT